MAAMDGVHKHAGGRPPKFDNAEQMQKAIDAYFSECDPHITTVEYFKYDKDKNTRQLAEEQRITEQKPYTMAGLALALGMSRQALIDYKNKDEFVDTIKRARQKIEADVERRMLSGDGSPAGVIFNAKNNFGWRDKSEVEHSGEFGLFGGDALTIQVVDGRDNPQS